MSLPEITDSILKHHLAIVGKTGSGKTITSKLMVERLLAAQKRTCVIDPTGAWWGLKSSADGKKPGFGVVVFGGDHADVPITEHSAKKLAEIIAKENMPSIIDLSEFNKSETQRFMTAFLETIYQKNRKSLHLIVDEADMFAPQRPMPGAQMMLNRMDTVVRRGRVKGLRVTMITQRPAVIHKDVLTQVNSMVMMRMTGPQDRKAIEDWIKYQADIDQGKKVLGSLARLPVGTGWLWAPEHDFLEQVAFPMITTFDSSKTPDDDEEILEPTNLAKVDLSGLTEMLAEEAPAKPSKGKASPVPTVNVAKIRKEAFDDGFGKGHVKGYQDGWTGATDSANKAIAEWARNPLVLIPPKVAHSETRIAPPVSKANGRHPVTTAKTLPLDESGESDIGPARRPLLTLVKMHPAKLTEPQWASLTGMKRSGTWSNYKSRLNQAGFIEKHGDLFVASQSGIEAMGGSVAKPQTAEEVIDLWRNAVGPAAKLFNILLQDHPGGRTKEQLAYAAEMSLSGTFSNYLSRLNSNNLITKTNGEYSVSAWLYTEPLRA